MTNEKTTDSAASALSAGLERPVLCVRPHRHRELLKLPEELEVGWLRGGHFWGFAACKNAAAFDALCEDLRKHHGEIDISDMRSNAKVTGSPALSASPRGLPG